MRQCGIILAALAALIAAGAADAQATGNLRSWSQSSLNIISDGTSNTITFGENTRFNVCFDNANLPGGITDGTSNTILFGEHAGLFVIPGGSGPRVPITSITDGSSNTIFLPETGDFCLNNVVIDPAPPPGGITDGTSNTIVFDEDTRFDICLRNVGLTQITDGTSNTIILGETTNRCYTDLRVVEVPEPASAMAALAGAALLALPRRRRCG